MVPTLRSLALASLAVLSLAAGCAGPPIPSPIEGEPICPDLTIGTAHAAMIGGLRYPVRMRVLDGKSPILKMILGGRRTADDPPARTLIADDNSEYTVEWAQCSNERAPVPADKGPKVKDPRNADKTARVTGLTAYECGDAVVYKTTTLVTKKGDAASHVVKFEPPPKAECWAGDVAPVPSATPSAAPIAPPPEKDSAPAASGAPSAGPAATGSASAGAPASSASAPPKP
ncbi:MAG: hypothetical protein U0359_17975 [Byssovorax sp.]